MDEVPQWVKEKVNHEEYKLWEVMSSVFQIDYSFLKKDISQERKKEILHLLQNTVSRIQNGSYNIENIIFMNKQNIPWNQVEQYLKQFLDLREELKSIEVGLFLYNIETYKEKLTQIIKDEEILQSQKQDEDNKMAELQSLKEKLKQEIDSITVQIEELQNIGFESTNKIEKINSEIGISNLVKKTQTTNIS